MAISMDSTVNHSSRERVQRLYNKNVGLENRRRRTAQGRIPSDPNVWQQMRDNYETILLEDHAFSEQHEIEYALWQLHYRRIDEIRAHLSAALASAGSAASQNGKGPTRPTPDRITKIRSQFKTFLSEATGFYHDLMVKIRAKYGLVLDYSSYDQENHVLSKDGNISPETRKSLISCHRCLIYLGDLARYKGLYGDGDYKVRDFAAASSYYVQASSLWPSSGNPHHQLAIMASYSGDELVTVYCYFRSLAIDSPFTTARDNLIIAFEKNRQSYSQLLGDAKASLKKGTMRLSGKGRQKDEIRASKDNRIEASFVKERERGRTETFNDFNIRFVRLNGILFTRTSLETFAEVFSMAKNDFLELLASGLDEVYNFGSDATDCRLAIIRLVAVLIFTVHNVNKETENQSYAEILQRSLLLQNAFTATFEFMGHIVERCMQLSDPSTSFLLSGIMVFVEWLACRKDITVGTDVGDKQAIARSFFWNQCVSFLNKILSSGSSSINKDEDETCFFNMSSYDERETANRLALFEDFELRGFLPLLHAQLILDFSRKHSFSVSGGKKETKVRVQRIIAAGKALANVVQVGQKGIYFDSKLKRFGIGVEPQMSDDYSLSSLAIPGMNDTWRENLVADQASVGLTHSNPPLCLEGEEEDEVIVFVPTVSEKHDDGVAAKLASSEVLGPGFNCSGVDLGSHVGSDASNESFLNVYSTSSLPSSSFANVTTEYLQAIQPNTSKWLRENEASISSELANLSLVDNGFLIKNGFPVESFVPTSVSVPFPHQHVNVSAGNKNTVQVSESAVPSKFDSSYGMPAGLRKSPVSRPTRHVGPPPGFSSIPPKVYDSGARLTSERPLIDDYSWLDGYNLSSGTMFNKFNHLAESYHPVSSSMGMVNFPFPGKQVSTVPQQADKQYGRPDYPLYQEQQQLQNGTKQSIALPKQCQGQSLWEGHFFV